MSEGRIIQDLTKVENQTPERIGGKAASLLALSRLAIKSPQAWVVETHTFSTFLHSLHLDPQLISLAKSIETGGQEENLEAIRRAILNSQLPDPMRAEIREFHRQWVEHYDRSVIVRSSATVEDSLHHSFAGVFESIPCRSTEEIEAAIKQVWASVFSPRAFSYYKIASLDRIPAMALIIQPLIQADRSGVLFTEFARPGQEPGILVEHVEGFGQKLVSGEVNPDRLWMDRWPEDSSSLPESNAGLSPEISFELSRIARILELELNHPQDIEWCTQSGELYIVQTRPITTATHKSASISSREMLVQGVGASPGVAGGAVHLVFNIEDADRLQTGQVLTTTMTNPDMVPTMQRSAAVVTDVGGMICHAAIVSRELGIPCVVGTKSGTQVLEAGSLVTVDGTSGAVYPGIFELVRESGSRRAIQWPDLWHIWQSNLPDSALPVISTRQAIPDMPIELRRCILDPFCDLFLDLRAEITPLAKINDSIREDILISYISALREDERAMELERIYLVTQRLDPATERHLERVVGVDRLIVPLRAVSGQPPWKIFSASDGEKLAVLDKYSPSVLEKSPAGATPAIPMGFGLLIGVPVPPESAEPAGGLEGMFGMMPAMRMARMPSRASRAPMHQMIPVLSRAHGGQVPESDQEFPWLDLRPEVIITPFLKAFVTPGVEVIPYVMGFDDPPLYIQFIRCRFHFRQDTLFGFFPKLMQSTWDENFLSDMLDRCRISYEALENQSELLPQDTRELYEAEDQFLRERFLVWWNAFTEFFSLSFFIQAQGDDCIFPALGAMVDRNLASLDGQLKDWGIPGLVELTAPVTPVLTAEYMQDLVDLHTTLDDLGLINLESAKQAIDRRADERLMREFEEVRARWFWMRERDLYYEPYDTPDVILEKALSVRIFPSPDYDLNKARAELALAIHFDLARQNGKEEMVTYAVKYGRALAIDRENHHVVWLRASYRLRKVLVEWERRFRTYNDLAPSSIFFMQPWEIVATSASHPDPVPVDLLQRIQNRRTAYEKEIQLKVGKESTQTPLDEGDYY